MDNNDEKSALDSMEQNLYDPKSQIQNMAMHHVRDRKEKELPTSWSVDTPILRETDDKIGLSFGLKFLIGSIALLVIVLSFAAWRVLLDRNSVSDKNIDMSLDVTPYVEGGEATPFVVGLNNRNEVPLTEATLTLMYKQGTGVQDEQEKVQVKKDVGTLNTGDFKRADFEVTLFGSEAEARDITVKLEYKVKGSRATFTKVGVAQVVLKSPPISIHVDGPKTLSVGQVGTFTFAVKNNTSSTTAPTLLIATLPTNFKLESAEPKPSTRGTVWQIAALSPGETSTVTLTGSLSGNQGEVATLRGQVGSVGGSVTEVGVVYSSETFDISLRSSPLILSFSFDTERGGGESLRYGDRILLTIHYKNGSTSALQNGKVILAIGGDAAVYRDVTTEFGDYDSTTGSISWNQGNVVDLGTIGAGAEGNLLVTIPIVTKGTNSPKLILTATAYGSATKVDDVVATTAKTYVVQGSASILAETHYKNSPFQNTGPIPPEPNVDTTYTVHLVVSAQNALQNTKVSFILPTYVTWRNVSTDAAHIFYDAKTRTVTWSVGTIAPGKTVATDIGVTVRPSQVHVRNSPAITSGIILEGDEVESKAHLKTTISGLTTYIGGEAWQVDPSSVVDK